MKLSPDTVIQRNKHIVSSEIDGETVMMDDSFSRYFGLKEVGTSIWRLLEEKHSIREICEQLTSEYDVDLEQCLEDVLPFLEELHTKNMIDVQN